MNSAPVPFPTFLPRDFFARFFIACALLLGVATARAQSEFEAAPPITNASGVELQAVKSTLDGLERAALNRDATALTFFGASVPADDAPLRLSDRLTHLAVTPNGALARQVFTLSIERQPAVILASGAQELFLSRSADGSFALGRRFAAPSDALGEMQKVAAEQWNNQAQNTEENAGSAVLDLVASRVGGRWISLRSQTWNGELAAAPITTATSDSARAFLLSRMKSAPLGRALTAHFLLQKGDANWFGVGAEFNEARRLPRAADSAASLWRARISSDSYTSPASHRDFGLTLTAVGLWNEAADELQKAELLQPGIVNASKLKEADANRVGDPENIVQKQRKAEESIGYGRDHPDYLISALAREQQNTPSVLGALRLALEYSRLAEEERAAAWGKQAQLLLARGTVAPRDAAWVQLLNDHLRERQKLAGVKPSNILRSKLFTVRVWPGDTRATALLASLEEAQHTVYADFGIPMGNTEVILWRDQSQFARYTTQFSEQGGSEFVAALTLTKLVSTQSGPLVLGEEINTFSQPRDGDAIFGTIAHEYGHVAVRQLSKGRLVPVWFNEGIATSVEGGYEGYLGRVRRAANADMLLPMRELLDWDVDGERAFLAYSQANSIVDFMVKNWGKTGVLDILRRIGRDTPPDDAFRSVLGVSQNQLWEKWVDAGIQ
ncbi:peptidase MA family metallohydrolase [Abditibacterium utsteinense]|nr:peptidase MA family metallohydrolase [Abditibacterium utsteinense]